MKKNSKFLSLVLRHKPEIIGLTLDSAGWVSVEDLLNALKKNNKNITFEELEFIVNNNDKKRFSFNEDKSKIRANQGHSIKVDLGYKESKPPEFLWHGTSSKYLDSIFKDGIKKMNRHHVHLSADFITAEKVGSRKGKPTVLMISSGLMYNDGHKFYLSDNGVWLTDFVPPQYINVKK